MQAAATIAAPPLSVTVSLAAVAGCSVRAEYDGHTRPAAGPADKTNANALKQPRRRPRWSFPALSGAAGDAAAAAAAAAAGPLLPRPRRMLIVGVGATAAATAAQAWSCQSNVRSLCAIADQPTACATQKHTQMLYDPSFV